MQREMHIFHFLLGKLSGLSFRILENGQERLEIDEDGELQVAEMRGKCFRNNRGGYPAGRRESQSRKGLALNPVWNRLRAALSHTIVVIIVQ